MRAIEILHISFPSYYRYVDDIVLAAPPSMFNTVLQTFNSFHPRLQFTIEEGVDNRLNFLDITFIIENNVIYFDWYHKPTFSGRYLHFESRHPLCHKKGTVIGLINRAFRLSSPCFHQKNLEFVTNILLSNGYPLELIFSTMYTRLKTLIYSMKKNINETATNSMNNNISEKFSYFNIPYVPAISEQFTPVVRDLQTKLSYTGINKLRRFIKVQKDRLPN